MSFHSPFLYSERGGGITLQTWLQVFCTLTTGHILRMGEQKNWRNVLLVTRRQHNSSQLFILHFFYEREISVFFKLLLFGVFCCTHINLILIDKEFSLHLNLYFTKWFFETCKVVIPFDWKKKKREKWRNLKTSLTALKNDDKNKSHTLKPSLDLLVFF